MDELSFYNGIGFKSSPFQYTNADQEENLEKYFIPPPYFQSVWGDPSKPSSCVIFAPRGGGKSAQRKMIETRSIGSNVLALQYSRFEFEKGQCIKDIDLDYHLRNINRLCLLALLMLIYELEAPCLAFGQIERAQIRSLCDFYLHDLNSEQVISAANSIIPFYEKARDFLKNNLWAISSIIETVFSKIGLPAVKGATSADSNKINAPSKNHLEIISSLIRTFGKESTYILVDKVDETELTGNDAESSFGLIEPLIRDLELLQMKNLAFKFFLWDELYPYYKQFARPDRIFQVQLNWTAAELRKMIKLRLQAYSATEEVVNFSDLFDRQMKQEVKEYAEDLVITFSHSSPRDMIRICRQMVTEQLRLDPALDRISGRAITSGFNIFCEDRAKEVVPDQILAELQKVHRLDFTVNYVASEVFKVDVNIIRVKIKSWLKTGMVKHIDDIAVQGSKKLVHHYAVVDSRVAKSIFKELKFVEFLKSKVRTCSACGVDMFRDWDLSSDHICQNCKVLFEAEV